jgi:S1-C subfamily serine protease
MKPAAGLLLLLGLAALGRAQDAGAKASVRALGDAFASVYENVAPSVVVLEVTKPEDAASANAAAWDLLFPGQQEPDPQPRLEESEGSGFIIREDGYIVTNAHVVEGADPRRGVVARTKDGKRWPLTVVGVDNKTDIAVLKAEANGWPAISWGDSDKARIGEFVCGIGAPFELDYTLTVGVLSAKGRSNLTRDTVYEDYLQTDAAINPGNSGGPLCDLDGRVLGVNTLINGLSRGLSFAIPSRLARDVSDELIAKGRVTRPWLGVRISTLGEEPDMQRMMGIEKGVLVKTIEPDAPAARSELRPADVIVAVDGEEVQTARDLQKVILSKKVGQQVGLKVWRRNTRDNSFRQISVTTAELPDSPFGGGLKPAPVPLLPPDSTEKTGAGAWGFALEKAPEGARVAGVDPGSPADVAGIKAGDIITGIGADAVSDEATFVGAMEKIGRDEAAVLMIERDGKKSYAILKR